MSQRIQEDPLNSANLGGAVFRYHSHRLCQAEFCEGHDYFNNTAQCVKRCPNIEATDLNQACKRLFSVFKVIRLCSVASLAPLLEKQGLKAVMTLRDPRAVAVYRAKHNKGWTMKTVINNLKWVCVDWQRSLEQVFFIDDDWMKSRFMIQKAFRKDLVTFPEFVHFFLKILFTPD